MTNSINNTEMNADNKVATFETTPVWKLILLSLATFGLYDLVWSYRYWKILKEDFEYDVLPPLRAIFMGFTNFWLFNILDKYMKSFKINSIRPVGLALLYLLFNICGKSDEVNIFLIAFLGVIPLAIIQHKINIINEKNNLPAKVNNWNTANTIWTILGIIFLVLAIIGFCMTEE